jgi:hypothetical protein
MKTFKKNIQRSVIVLIPIDLVHVYARSRMEKACMDTLILQGHCTIGSSVAHMGLYSYAKEYNMRAVCKNKDKDMYIIELMPRDTNDIADKVMSFVEKKLIFCDITPYLDQIHFDYDTNVANVVSVVAPFYIPN